MSGFSILEFILATSTFYMSREWHTLVLMTYTMYGELAFTDVFWASVIWEWRLKTDVLAMQAVRTRISISSPEWSSRSVEQQKSVLLFCGAESRPWEESGRACT